MRGEGACDPVVDAPDEYHTPLVINIMVRVKYLSCLVQVLTFRAGGRCTRHSLLFALVVWITRKTRGSGSHECHVTGPDAPFLMPSGMSASSH